jgi:SAM-dependent methyltransferase
MPSTLELTTAWESAYDRRENYVFQPSSELVRFVARYFRRRVGLDDYVDVLPGVRTTPILDACCGIGRNLVFGTEMGLQMHGFDLSERAIGVARDWLARAGVEQPESRTFAASADALPWADGFFGHALCEDALDSMPFAIATAGIAEIARVVRPGGLFYCSLIGAEESGRGADYSEEIVVSAEHERDTIQSFFDRGKLETMLLPYFERVALYQVTANYIDPASGPEVRWYFIGRRR